MSSLNATCNTFITQLKADKKKAVLLGIMLLAMLGVYARWLLKAKPADAQADAPIAASPQASAAPTGTTPVAAPTQAATIAASDDSIDAGPLSRKLARDLFDTDLSIFAVAPEITAEQNREAATQPSRASRWMTALSRMMERQSRRAENNRQEVEAQLSKLILQGTILGPKPKASINGQILHEGDIIGGFSILEIGPRYVTLQKSGCNYRLSML